ncbi:hypothetical protein [Deinococcus cellulosilyticus]|uniref:Uncharacterized protein n=1 Tax=Deinococcus cellulosilyticus (strain DSM 18568 / NBRC 106333 / KACC 11606 / 5516J-15) TaxID=1223518 RepID=A0A511MWA3_DEIC1|nr:hypothetical protein [Deinococcus cellulosilyticus]GEM44457.1 hypothetical protein DC3_00920 [Deinococcus cellulosilyticus NBRC 106333 = KACC 11606]
MKPAHALNVRWVPGTSNRLILSCQQLEKEVPLQKFEAVCGKQATFDLYLVGRVTLDLPRSQMDQLGV